MKLSSLLQAAAVIATFATTAAYSQNLLSNPTFDLGYTGFSSAYNFVGSGTSATEQTFGIRNESLDYNPGYVHFFDHTSGTGNMMLVDGALSLGPTVWEETVSVLPGTDYSFSAWATTADDSHVPTLRFSINSIQIGSDLLLPVSTPNWQHFTNTWNSGASTSATISIIDANTESFGNDFALDDMSFSSPTPEPTTALLLGIGAVATTLVRRRRQCA